VSRLAPWLALLGGLAVGLWGEQVLMRRERARPDAAAQDDFSPLADALHRVVETGDGGRLHVVERGQGRPLVLLHGVSLSAATWRYQLADLADHFRVIAVDQRGHGQSEPGDGGLSLVRLADDVAELLAALDLRDAVLVGHSMGGLVALQFLIDHADAAAERVAGAVLLSSLASTEGKVHAWHLVSTMLAPVNAMFLRAVGRLPGGYMPSTDLSYLIARGTFGRAPSPTHVDLTRAMTAATDAGVLAEFTVEIARAELRHRLRRVAVPVWVVAGSRDMVTPMVNAKEIVRHLPGAELKVLRGGGHMLMLERRREVAELLEKFAAGL
jgi:pimeloyl-ACP methyl ester carboxylesterase